MGTIKFKIDNPKDNEIRDTIKLAYEALKERGYDPVSQFLGYIISDDPTYITGYNKARSAVSKYDRDELLEVILKEYLSKFES